MLNVRFIALVGIVVLAAVMRIIPHPPNFTPISAMALFGGAYFPNTIVAFIVPLAAMSLSDLFLGGFDATMPFIYGSFAVSVCLGLWIRRRPSVLRVGAAALISSILFFVISNFGVWLVGGLYPRTMEGLLACYVAAVPFFRHTLLGDLLYTSVLFGGFAFMQRFFPLLRGRSERAMENA
jgi:hypothetical protein